jgi:mRNA interferase RelE/StbE
MTTRLDRSLVDIEGTLSEILRRYARPAGRDPHHVGAPLREPYKGLWRARRGEYRVRHQIDDHDRTVYVLDIDHRGDAYRG